MFISSIRSARGLNYPIYSGNYHLDMPNLHLCKHSSTHCHACNNPRSLQQPESFVAVAKRRPIKVAYDQPATPSSRSTRIWKTGPTARTVWIRNLDVPDLIGKGGKNQRRLMDETGANNIFAYQDRVTEDGMCPVEITGNPKAVLKAVAIIEEKFVHKQLPSRLLTQQDPSASTSITWILDADVAEFIGPRGRHVQQLQAKTGVTYISALQEQVNEAGMCPIHIEGSDDAVQKAISEIEGHYGGMSTPRKTRPMNYDRGPVETWPLVESGPQQCLDQPTLDNASAEAVFNHVVVGINASNLEPNTREEPAVVSSEAQEARPPIRPFTAPETEARLNRMTNELKSTLGISSIQLPAAAAAADKADDGGILGVLKEYKGCVTCTAATFRLWLESVDILTLEDFVHALDDDDFVREEMKVNGLKYFKRYALRKGAIAAMEERRALLIVGDSLGTETISPTTDTAASNNQEHNDVMHGLICPIGQVLMVNDPVQAADGFFYERQAIENWFATSSKNLCNNPDDGNGCSAVRSPLTGDILSNLTLTSSPVIRSMARDFAKTNPSAL